MATNKHAMIRYQALDKCFSNRFREFYIDDLIKACNDAIYEFDGSVEGVKRRTVFSDILFMESSQGWSAEIKRNYVGKRCYYRYADPDFSINKKDLSDAELDKIDEALVMLNRFKGAEGFDWIDEFVANFEDKLGRKKQAKPVIGYEQNPFLKGIEHLSPLFNYIVNHQVLKVLYTGFNKGQKEYLVHPYFLKQYNNRWFLFGITEENRENLTNLALDRIDSIEPAHVDYIPNESFDFRFYFEDVVGVSVPREGELLDIVLRFDERTYPYVENKPIHGSQTPVPDEPRTIRLSVFDTYELESEILAFGEHVEILEPASFREKIAGRVRKMAGLY